jgi:hypothetical protein
MNNSRIGIQTTQQNEQQNYLINLITSCFANPFVIVIAHFIRGN